MRLENTSRVLFVTDLLRQSNERDITNLMGVKNIDFVSVQGPRDEKRLTQRVKNMTYDLVMCTKYVGHTTANTVLSAAKSSSVPMVMVGGGRPGQVRHYLTKADIVLPVKKNSPEISGPIVEVAGPTPDKEEKMAKKKRNRHSWTYKELLHIHDCLVENQNFTHIARTLTETYVPRGVSSTRDAAIKYLGYLNKHDRISPERAVKDAFWTTYNKSNGVPSTSKPQAAAPKPQAEPSEAPKPQPAPKAPAGDAAHSLVFRADGSGKTTVEVTGPSGTILCESKKNLHQILAFLIS